MKFYINHRALSFLFLFYFLFVVSTANGQEVKLDITTLAESSELYSPGTNFNIPGMDEISSESDDPVAPFDQVPVLFKGFNEDGANRDDRLGDSYLVYRYQLDFERPVRLDSVQVTGVAFFGLNSAIRVLDASRNVVGFVGTEGENSSRVFTVEMEEVTGTRFFLEEYDAAPTWRFRESIEVLYTDIQPGPDRVLVEDVTSSLFPAGTEWEGHTSQSPDPLGPFSGTAVHFRGTETGGNTTQAIGDSHLIYSYVLEYDRRVQIERIIVEGNAFNGSDSVIQLLDGDGRVVASQQTSGGNDFRTFTLEPENAVGGRFILREYDSSQNWRFRSLIQVIVKDSSSAPDFVSVDEDSSATWPADTLYEGLISATADPLGPFYAHPVHFRGTLTGGNTSDMQGDSSLVYRYSLDFETNVRIEKITVSGSAFSGQDSVIRLLDDSGGVLASQATSGDNTFQTFALTPDGAIGSSFVLEEYDSSTTWRYRSEIVVTYNDNFDPDDTEGDGLTDAWELRYFTDILVSSGEDDPDKDGLINADEETEGTSPIDADTDDDGFSDGFETSQTALNPLESDKALFDNVVQSISGDPYLQSSTGLYTEQGLMNLGVPVPVIRVEQGLVRLRLQLEISDTLAPDSWRPFGDAVLWETAADADHSFFRIMVNPNPSD